MLIPPIRQISLLTDFGLQDIYVGVMKGVIDKIAPQCKVIDLCHHIPPGETKVAALMLLSSVPYFSPETLHVCVIDPGVGSDRRIIYVATPMGHFLAPDNGLLTPIFDKYHPYQVWSVTNSDFMLPKTSNTFHGRDIFSPVAAHLARGVPAKDLGPEIKDPMQESPSLMTRDGEVLKGEVIYVDGFGNVCTNIPACYSAALKSASFPQSDLTLSGPVSHSYNSKKPGDPLIIVNSFAYLELAINRGNAAERFHVERGHRVEITLDAVESFDNP